jgi:hypothetical protein
MPRTRGLRDLQYLDHLPNRNLVLLKHTQHPQTHRIAKLREQLHGVLARDGGVD